MVTSGWISVRCILRSVHDGEQIYEERVTLWRATSLDEAMELAEDEARDYAEALSTPAGRRTEYVGLAQAYLLSDELGHGAEVFSLMRVSDLPAETYLDTFFDTGAERQR